MTKNRHEKERSSRRQKTLAIFRRGHFGDVILTEPVIRPFLTEFDHLTLYTDFPKAAQLLDLYDEIKPYSTRLEVAEGTFDRVLCPVYETYPGINHLDGYAQCLGVHPYRRVPKIKRGAPKIAEGQYVLIAPHTSEFVKGMRQWPFQRFQDLAQRLEHTFLTRVVLLTPEHTFEEMVSLIEHCAWFVGNDSGPAILAQCFGKVTFIIFGATRPELVTLSTTAVALLHYVGCNGCKHFARHTDIECATPMCLLDFEVEEAFEQIRAEAWRISKS